MDSKYFVALGVQANTRSPHCPNFARLLGECGGVMLRFTDIQTDEQCMVAKIESRHHEPFLVTVFYDLNRGVQACRANPPIRPLAGRLQCAFKAMEMVLP